MCRAVDDILSSSILNFSRFWNYIFPISLHYSQAAFRVLTISRLLFVVSVNVLETEGTFILSKTSSSNSCVERLSSLETICGALLSKTTSFQCLEYLYISETCASPISNNLSSILTNFALFVFVFSHLRIFCTSVCFCLTWK